jgi:hypothetical protein
MPEPLDSPVLVGAATPDGQGYWLASADGGVFAFGDAPFEGSLGDQALQGPIVGMAATPDGRGYWLVGLDGGVFAFGDAPFLGSMGATRLNQPIVGMAATADGEGYWLVAADGGVFAFGDAPYVGSTGGTTLNEPIVGMAATADDQGYWLVAADGGIFTFGDARFFGSWSAQDLPDPVVGIIASPDGGGYTVATADGVVLTLGDAQNDGGLSLDPDATPVSAIIGNGAGTGYWLLDPEGWTYTFTTATPEETFPGSPAIVAAAASQIAPDPDTGYFCNPYGPCEQWCALFATWAWRQAGVAGRGGHPLLRLRRGHLRLGPEPRRRPGTDGQAGPGRRRPVRHRTAQCRDLGPRGDRHPGVARRRHRHGGRRFGPGPGRLALGHHQRPLSALGLALVQRGGDLRLRPTLKPPRHRARGRRVTGD